MQGPRHEGAYQVPLVVGAATLIGLGLGGLGRQTGRFVNGVVVNAVAYEELFGGGNLDVRRSHAGQADPGASDRAAGPVEEEGHADGGEVADLALELVVHAERLAR